MFEGFKIVWSLKKLVKNTSNIPGTLVGESEHLAKQNFYSAQDVALIIIQTALNMNYINRSNLTDKGEKLLSDIEKTEAELD